MKILFFGSVAPYKGLDVLLAAIESLEDQVSLLIAGSAKDQNLTREIAACIAVHPARKHITWRNEFIPESELSGLFRDSDVLVLPYRYIDQSGVLFQALRHGLPVVATKVGSLHEYVTHEIGETCNPSDSVALRDALLKLRSRLTSISRARIAEIGRSYEWPLAVGVLRFAYAQSIDQIRKS